MTADPEMAAAERAVIEAVAALRWQRNHHAVIIRGWADSGHFPHVINGSQDAVNEAEIAHDAAVAALIALRAARGLP